MKSRPMNRMPITAPSFPLIGMYFVMKSRPKSLALPRYASPDKAQQDFLAKGGPDRDRLGVDPDGDGFACSWDPRPFRTALQ